MNKRPYVIPPAQLERLKDLSLFYPCSGEDYYDAIAVFSPYITDFWFVDKRYFTLRSALDCPPVLRRKADYELLDVKVEGLPLFRSRDPHIWPCIRTETYKHLPSKRVIRIHRRRGYGYSTLRYEGRMGKLGVFFYRGDSPGGGGSGDHWLRGTRLSEIFTHLVDGGLLAIDGSNGGANSQRHSQQRGAYKELFKYFYSWTNGERLTSKQLVEGVSAFTDEYNRHYECIGYAGDRYGPTMIWNVDRSNSAEPLIPSYEKIIRDYDDPTFDRFWLTDRLNRIKGFPDGLEKPYRIRKERLRSRRRYSVE